MFSVQQRSDATEYRDIFLNDTPLIDVRAPIEFKQGAFPQAKNLPLLEDTEREAVGICYKQQGVEAAVALGEQLVSDDTRQTRLISWMAACQNAPQGYLYCFRGGLRSHTVQRWLAEAGMHYPLVVGGYKALRHFLIDVNETVSRQPQVIVGGQTGCGKTLLIKELNHGVDLEGMAHHRGSSFGRTLVAQSSQVDFEHRLAIAFLKKQAEGITSWILEDEGRTIGSNHLPLPLYASMQNAPLVVIEDPFEIRLQRLQEEYFVQMKQAFLTRYDEETGWREFSEYLHHGLYAIRKRLGLERYTQLAEHLDQALVQHRNSQNSDPHLAWLIPLLKEYYDPMYRYQLDGKANRVCFRGTYQEVREYLLSQTK